jgi:hypothetical protein
LAASTFCGERTSGEDFLTKMQAGHRSTSSKIQILEEVMKCTETSKARELIQNDFWLCWLLISWKIFTLNRTRAVSDE